MEPPEQLQQWLSWIIRIRFVIITFVFAIAYLTQELLNRPGDEVSVKALGITIILWYVLGLFFLIYNQISRDLLLQAYIQICGDIVLITAIVHVTGDLDSNFISLYFLAVIMASMVLARSRAFLIAGVSFIAMASMLEMAYLPGIYPAFAQHHQGLVRLIPSAAIPVDLTTLELKILASLFGFFAVAYLSSYLAERLRKADEELRDKAGEVASLQALNENVIQSMRGGLITTDLDFKIRVVNRAGEAILGRRSAELEGCSLGEALQLGSYPAAQFSADGGAYIRRELAYRRPEGEERILGVSASPLDVPERGVEGYVYTFQDLTEEKQREADDQLKERMATLGRMAAGIAHEIRNPLASISGSVKLLHSVASMNDDQAKLMNIVSRESARLDKLVSDFLAYSRDQRFEFQPVDLVNLLDETLLLLEQNPLFSPQCRVMRIFPHRPIVASVDPDKMRQVFWNICNNSLKAMPGGGCLTAEVRERAARKVLVILSDSGVGLSPEQVESVFEPFHPRFPDGTGLGLAISYQIVKAHRGDIQVSSTRGEGARFLIELPRRQEENVRSYSA
ncbi:MAG: two-component system sensor histidine kinase NtrB [Terriglobia bacterium]